MEKQKWRTPAEAKISFLHKKEEDPPPAVACLHQFTLTFLAELRALTLCCCFSPSSWNSTMAPEIIGVRFRPYQGELLNHHLKSKLQNNNYDEGRCVIPELNIYDHDPRDLHAIYNERSCKKSTSSDSYFFCPRDKMDTIKRKAGRGYWKETSKKQRIEDEETGEVIGIKRIFSFYEGNQRNARKTEFAMHVYHLNAAVADDTIPDPTAFALCHVKKKQQWKRASPKKQQSQLSDSSYCGANSGSFVTPRMSEVIETQKTNLESSLVMDGLIHSDNSSSGGSKCSPEQLKIYPGFQETISDAAFPRETTMDFQNLPTQTWPDFTPFEDGRNTAASNQDDRDGISIEELLNWDEPYQRNTLPF